MISHASFFSRRSITVLVPRLEARSNRTTIDMSVSKPTRSRFYAQAPAPESSSRQQRAPEAGTPVVKAFGGIRCLGELTMQKTYGGNQEKTVGI